MHHFFLLVVLLVDASALGADGLALHGVERLAGDSVLAVLRVCQSCPVN